ncbi:lactate dehydrogenase [Cryobacterium algoritolerans]|uniref:Lactate dehydrogenase n=1 Tax=Cryobacterium algoritolerans TaxID=1259184 RepID=A0A4R8WUB7_9MICO|nr:NAD(P)-binding domain-containing protein [Cryobacterium algoritolerans]TFC17410.1 lactate dehydrogenase [Cryobacterium algoritolerans]
MQRKIGVIGAGAVGTTTVGALLGSGQLDAEIVIVNRNHGKAVGLAEDMQHAAALSSTARVSAGGYDLLDGADLVIVTAGVNEKNGGATDRIDPRGRRVLIPDNAKAYSKIIPAVAAAAPTATILVVTDPPDPLADLARVLAPGQPVLSTGTVIDSLRFRAQIARALGVQARDVSAYVIGEHGTSNVYLWSTATVGGARVLDLLARRGDDVEEQKTRIRKAVTYGNISIIEGIGASQHGIGAVVARITEAILRDERAVLPVASYLPEYGTTIALPSIVGARGVIDTILPTLTDEERDGLADSAQILRDAGQFALASA